MKKILTILMSAIVAGTTLLPVGTASASTNKLAIEDSSIVAGLAYLESLGCEVTVNDYSKLTKADIEEAIRIVEATPEVLVLDESNSVSGEEIVTNVKEDRASVGKIETVSSYKDYNGSTTEAGNQWAYKVRVHYTYTRYVEPGYKQFKTLESANSEDPAVVTAWSYSELGSISHSFSSDMKMLTLKGRGQYSIGVGSLSINHKVSFSVSVTP